MPDAQPSPTSHPSLSRHGEQMVAWIRELEECRIGGIISDEDYGYQRAEKFATILRPMRGLWLASVLGAALLGGPAAAAVWLLTRDARYTAVTAAVGCILGLLVIGHFLREMFTNFQLRERRKILIALLESDLLTASEFADYDDRLVHGQRDVM